jgi:hypothetical protein
MRGSIFHRYIFLYITLQLLLSTVVASYKCSTTIVSFCIPLPDSMTALTLLTVTSFLVGIFSNNLMQRWWQLRTALNSVKSKSTNLVNSFTAAVAVNASDSTPYFRAQAVHLTQTVKRYLQLAHALIYIRGNPAFKCHSTLLMSRNLITAHEVSLLTPQETSSFKCMLPTQVYSWVLLCLEKSSTAGVLGPVPGASAQHVVTFFAELSAIQASAADVDMYITTQLPYPFVQMTALLGRLILLCNNMWCYY